MNEYTVMIIASLCMIAMAFGAALMIYGALTMDFVIIGLGSVPCLVGEVVLNYLAEHLGP